MTHTESRILGHSQNFIRNPEIVHKILDKSYIAQDDTVLEIGPGTGVITKALAERCRKVIAIEADTNLFQKLKEELKNHSSVEIYNGDFLHFKLPDSSYKVFSNIPFNITANVIRKLTSNNSPEVSYLFVQEEAARKYIGSPYDKETLSSVLNKPWFNLSITHKFQRDDFRPIPKVNVVLLQIEKIKQPHITPDKEMLYKDFVTYGFTRVKPTLKKSYEKVFGHIQFLKLAGDIHFDVTAKPTNLKFEQWLAMFNYFLIGVNPERQRGVRGSFEVLQKQQEGLIKINRTRTAKNWKTLKYAD